MEYQAYENMSDAIEKAQESIVPFPIVNGDEIIVAGDANETQTKKSDLRIRFRVPDAQEDGSIKYHWREKEFKGVYITPRQDTKIVRLIAQLMPYFKKINEDGGIKAMTDDEKLSVYDRFDDEVFDLMYKVTASVLGIDKALTEYMHPMDVVNAATQIMETYPELVNEADTFFV